MPSVPPTRRRRGDYLTDFRSDVYWWEPDGRVVRVSPGDGLYAMACVHPEGEQVVFWGGASGRPRLWIADADGGATPITPADVSARHPAYGLSGDLVYCRSVSPTETVEALSRGRTSLAPHPRATMSLVLRDAQGRERDLTDGTHLDERPALRPDGRRVAFVSRRGSARGLWTIGTEEGAVAEPLLAGTASYRPWWSTDGRTLYFFVLNPDRHQIHAIPAQGGRPTPLANDDRGDTHGPYADPDGRHLLVHSTREHESNPERGRWGLYELPLAGGPPRRLMPPGYVRGAHATRARNGVITFDVARPG